MKRLKYIMPLLIGLLFMMVAQGNSALDDLQKRLSSFHSLKANFKQALYTDKKEAQSSSRGTMAIARPGKFRWDTQAPNEQILVADGNRLWIYDVDLEQATRQKLDTTDSNSPALFLSGDVKAIPQRFTVSAEKTKGTETFKLKAKSSDDMFQSIKIVFRDGKLSQMIVGTRIGQRSDFNFSRVEVNPQFPRNTFDFKPPAGVDVLTNVD